MLINGNTIVRILTVQIKNHTRHIKFEILSYIVLIKNIYKLTKQILKNKLMYFLLIILKSINIYLNIILNTFMN